MKPSLFVQLRSGAPTADVYRDAIGITVEAESLGFETVWFATRHFGAHHAALPAVFPFLAAAAQHTSRIGLGAGVVALPFENPVRLAEDAVVTDQLSAGRVQLGVGKGLGFGLSATAYTGFTVDVADRESLYSSGLLDLHRILDGGRVADGVDLYPHPGSLRRRIWQSTGNIATARSAAAAGDGILPHGNSEARGGRGVPELVDAYREAYAGVGPPRIGASVALVPGDSRSDALALFDHDIASSPSYYDGKIESGGPAAYLDKLGTHVGSSDDLVPRILETPSIGDATEVLFHIPLALGHPRYLESLRQVGKDIVPRLG